MEIREVGLSEYWARMPMDEKKNDLQTQNGKALTKSFNKARQWERGNNYSQLFAIHKKQILK